MAAQSRFLIYCRGAFGGPSPAGLTACTALPPPALPLHPHAPATPALICTSVERAKPKFFKANSLGDHREYLPREWTLLVKRRLVLSRAGDDRMVARFGDPQSDFSGSFQFAVGVDGCCVFGDVR